MEIFGILFAVIAIYLGFNSMPIYWLAPLAIVGGITYILMRLQSMLQMLQSSGLIKTTIFLFTTQFFTWLLVYGIGKIGNIIFS